MRMMEDAPSEDTQAIPLRFEIRHPTHREEVSSDSDFVVFGRDPSCDIVIKNPRCSRRHLSVRVVPDGFRLIDMGSSNGVYVLGQKIDDAIIREGDVFSMGDVFVRMLPEDMPATLAMARSEATLRQIAPPIEPLRRPLPPPMSRVGGRTGATPILTLHAPRVLGISSLAVGAALVIAPLTLRAQSGGFAYVVSAVGLASAGAGLGLLSGFRWARGVHYALFAIWTLTCLMAPLGVIGLAYQLRGEEHLDTDSFFATVIGIAGALAVIALITATFLAQIYVPSPLPL